MFDAATWLDVICDDPDADFASADGMALASGANRLLVGDEILQFGQAVPQGTGRWRLQGLLRGRGGTEAEALAGHGPATRVVLLDERLLLLDGATFDPATERLAAIGLGDAEPVYAAVTAPGRSRRPLTPVHPQVRATASGAIELSWVRRARGAWIWRDGVDVPLVEESERYEVGAGPVLAPIMIWQTEMPTLIVAADALATLPSGTPLWVRQLGTYARSRELLLHLLP